MLRTNPSWKSKEIGSSLEIQKDAEAKNSDNLKSCGQPLYLWKYNT